MDVLMPQLGETVLEGTVATWHKKPGDAVAKGEMLLDVETDKAATEIEVPADGVLASINVAEGDTVDVGTVLAVITVEGRNSSGRGSGGAPQQAHDRPGRYADCRRNRRVNEYPRPFGVCSKNTTWISALFREQGEMAG